MFVVNIHKLAQLFFGGYGESFRKKFYSCAFPHRAAEFSEYNGTQVALTVNARYPMLNGRNRLLGVVAGAACAFLMIWGGSNSAHAAAVQIVSGGQLTGAQNVDVNGTLYDVTFEDGTCIALFGGCDQLSDFTFTSLSTAEAAAHALLDQVFLDTGSGDFDSNPSLTNGCTSTYGCTVGIPYSVSSFLVAGANNYSSSSGVSDSVLNFSNFDKSNDLSDAGDRTYALFSPSAVPVPGGLVLFGSGLIGLAGFGRWRRKKSVLEI